MKIERGTKRAQRREAARRAAEGYGVPGKYFAQFWRGGATREAAEGIVKAGRAREEADAALTRAALAVQTAAEKRPA